jgi:hypothetical protein
VVPETRNQLHEMKDARVPAANQLSFSPERLEAIRERFDPDVAAMKIPVIGNREKLIFEYNGGCRDTTTRDYLANLFDDQASRYDIGDDVCRTRIAAA